MKVQYEVVNPDEGSCFRILHLDEPVSTMTWEYHYHPEVELICVLSGNGTRHVGYHKSNFIDGDLVLIGSNVPHSGFGLNANDPHEEIVVQIKEDLLLNSISNITELRKVENLISISKFGILFSKDAKEKIKPKMVILNNLEGSKRYIYLLEILAELANFKYELLNQEIMPYSIISKNKARLETLFTYVENNYNQEIAIQEMADLSAMSLPAFCNFFKKATKMTFTEFVNRYRINKACMLISQDKSISEACYECGFNNVTYFNKIFKKYVLKTPTEFKNDLI